MSVVEHKWDWKAHPAEGRQLWVGETSLHIGQIARVRSGKQGWSTGNLAENEYRHGQ